MVLELAVDRCPRVRLHVRAVVAQLPAGAADHRIEALLRFGDRSEEHTSELQSLMRISYAVFCLKKKKKKHKLTRQTYNQTQNHQQSEHARTLHNTPTAQDH